MVLPVTKSDAEDARYIAVPTKSSVVDTLFKGIRCEIWSIKSLFTNFCPDRIIQKYQYNHPKLFRPQGGYIDTTLLKKKEKFGYKVVLWSYHQETKDYALPGAQVITDHIIRHAKNGFKASEENLSTLKRNTLSKQGGRGGRRA